MLTTAHLPRVSMAKTPDKQSEPNPWKGSAAGVGGLKSHIAAARVAGYPYYTYTLADERGVFYVGKGQRLRVLAHGTAHDRWNERKRERLSCGEVQRAVVAFFVDEPAALQHERELIAESRGSLTNITNGGVEQNPREAAMAMARRMLNQMAPLEKWRESAHLKYSWFGVSSLRELHDWIRAELTREAVDPSPTGAVTDRDGRFLRFTWGSR